MKELSLAGFFREIGNAAIRVEAEERVVLTAGAKIVQRQAKAEIGHYQPESGPFMAWLELKESTRADKELHGFAPPDNPLLRTGDLRDSIEITVGSMEAHIGSNSDVAEWQELGTKYIPPRSFLGSAAFQTRDKVGRVMGSGLAASLIGESVHKGRIAITDGD